MARSIKQIVHDMGPSTDSILQISTVLEDLLLEIKKEISLTSKKTKENYQQVIEGLEVIKASTHLLNAYLKEVNEEADQENIPKTYNYKP